MPQKPHKDRKKTLEKIARRRFARLKTPSGSEDKKQRGELPSKFTYTDEQRDAIASALGSDVDLAAEALDTIELIVNLTAQVIQYRAMNPVSREQEKKFRDLQEPITQILESLDHAEFAHLEDYVPHLRTELRVLLHMVESVQRKRPGRPRDPRNTLLAGMVARLVDIWAQHHGWPKRWFRDEVGRDWGPFYRFLDACLEPSGCQRRSKNRPRGGVKVYHFGTVRSLSPKSTGGSRARLGRPIIGQRPWRAWEGPVGPRGQADGARSA